MKFFPAIGRDNRILMLALFLWALGEGLWLNLQSIYIEELGATPKQVGLVLALAGVARVIFLLPGGWLSDRYGPRPQLLASWLLGIVAVAMIALAPDWRWSIPGFFLYGASIFVIPAISSYILMALPEGNDETAGDRALPTVYSGFSAGVIIATPLGGLLAGAYGIRATFWVACVAYAVSTAVMLRLPHYVVKQLGEATTSDAPASGANWRNLLRNRRLVLLLFYIFIAFFAMEIAYPLTGNFLHSTRDLPVRTIGILSSGISTGTVVWSLLLGRFRPRYSFPMAQALAMLAAVAFLYSGAIPAVVLAYFLMGGINAAHSMATAGVARNVTAEQRGMAFGFSEVAVAIAFSLSPSVAGLLYDKSPELPFVATAIIVPVVIIFNFLLFAPRRKAALAVATSEADAAL